MYSSQYCTEAPLRYISPNSTESRISLYAQHIHFENTQRPGYLIPVLNAAELPDNASDCPWTIILLHTLHIFQQVLIHHKHRSGLDTSPNSSWTNSSEPSCDSLCLVDDFQSRQDRRSVEGGNGTGDCARARVDQPCLRPFRLIARRDFLGMRDVAADGLTLWCDLCLCPSFDHIQWTCKYSCSCSCGHCCQRLQTESNVVSAGPMHGKLPFLFIKCEL